MLSKDHSAALLSRIGLAMRKLRIPHFSGSRTVEWKPNEPIIYFEETCFKGQPFLVPLIILKTQPCRWFKSGGCVMCNYELFQARNEPVDSKSFEEQVEFALRQLNDLKDYHYVFLGSGGSFLDDFEVPMQDRLAVLKRLRQADVRAVSFESEAKYCLDSSRLLPLKKIVDKISIGIGLESADPFIRNFIINKGLPDAVLSRALKTLKECDISFYFYLMLGKPFLSVIEDEVDCINSILWSLEAGARIVVVGLNNIQPSTLTEFLWKEGTYRPPSLWSGLHVLLSLPADARKRVSLKGVEADDGVPAPFATSDSCPRCRSQMLELIKEWNLHRNEATLQKAWNLCSCRVEYEKTRSASSEDMQDRCVSEWNRVCDKILSNEAVV